MNCQQLACVDSQRDFQSASIALLAKESLASNVYQENVLCFFGMASRVHFLQRQSLWMPCIALENRQLISDAYDAVTLYQAAWQYDRLFSIADSPLNIGKSMSGEHPVRRFLFLGVEAKDFQR